MYFYRSPGLAIPVRLTHSADISELAEALAPKSEKSNSNEAASLVKTDAAQE